MKYTIKMRQTVVRELNIEVEANNVVQAMDSSEAELASHEPVVVKEYTSKWVAYSVIEKTD